MNLISGLKKKNAYIHFSPTSCLVEDHARGLLWSKGIGKDRRVGKLSFLEKLRLPQSFALPFFFCCVWSSTPLFLLWHRRLGHVSSPRLRYFLSTGMLGSVPNIEISTCMGCKLGKNSGPSFLKLFLLFLLILCPPASLLSKGGSSVYVMDDRTMKKLTQIKGFHSDS